MSEKCFHCQEEIREIRREYEGHVFCCDGCRTVYEILSKNNLINYYELNSKAGIKPEITKHFDYLDSPQIFEKIVDFVEGDFTLLTFNLPSIHCSACIWLLESLQEINPKVKYATVNFTAKTIQIYYNSKEYKLSELANFLTSLGYKPNINLETLDRKTQKPNRALIMKLAVAGFAFGNNCLFAIPEFVDKGDIWLNQFSEFFRIIMFLISLPVVFYSASVYYKSAWGALKHKRLNIDIPIVIGIFALFFQSCYEAYFNISNGYFDTLCGLVFFMLIGKYFQERTYKTLAFDRDYKSFYPIAVTKIEQGKEENILLSELKVGDRILIRNQEIIPSDSILMKGEGFIDNSFITGESDLIPKKPGERIYAGGKQSGAAIELEVIKEMNQSYLTSLWNHEIFNKNKSSLNSMVNIVSKYFVIVILIITILSGLYWYFIREDVHRMFQVIVAILIIACPCALALSTPFAMGNIMRILGKQSFYVKDSSTIENLSKINHIVFDKTGTLTMNKEVEIAYKGKELTLEELSGIKAIIKNSNHPLSRNLYNFIPQQVEDQLEMFEEIPGKGIQGKAGNKKIRLGSARFVGVINHRMPETSIYVRIDNEIKGRFIIKNQYRRNLKAMIGKLKNYAISVLSGDNDSERKKLQEIFSKNVDLLFNQSPEDKMMYIKKLQDSKRKIMMLGDGLNDAGALKQSDVGIAISDNINSFTPSSDVIMDGKKLKFLPEYLKLSKYTIRIIIISFILSFIYNIIGLGFAITGNLNPLVAAILMPISSISVVIFTTLSTRLIAWKVLKA